MTKSPECDGDLWQNLMIFARLNSTRSWQTRRAVAAAFFVASLLTSFAIAAHAGPPAPLRVVTPFTWMQFKQQFGVLDPNNVNILADPGTPTAVFGTGQDATGGVGGTLQFGQQIEGFLIGDHGGTEL